MRSIKEILADINKRPENDANMPAFYVSNHTDDFYSVFGDGFVARCPADFPEKMAELREALLDAGLNEIGLDSAPFDFEPIEGTPPDCDSIDVLSAGETYDDIASRDYDIARVFSHLRYNAKGDYLILELTCKDSDSSCSRIVGIPEIARTIEPKANSAPGM